LRLAPAIWTACTTSLLELREATLAVDNEDQMDMLTTLIEGRRLRDISDLPFDLAV